MDYADLREGLYDHLCTEIASVSNRIFWGFTAPADTVKPFLVLTFVGELPSVNTPCGLFMQFSVDVLGEEGNILAIDPIADEVVSALHQVDIVTPVGRTIRCEYRRDARTDEWSETFRANVITLRFMLPTDLWT